MEKMKKLNDVELLRLVQNEDAAAFEELYRRYHNLVYFVAYKACKCDADAQDIVQETFIQLKNSIHNLRQPQYFRLWLYRIIDSKCKKLFRKNKFDITELERDSVQYEALEDHIAYVPQKSMHFSSDKEMIEAFIDELPYSQKIVVMLFYMEECTVLEIAKICDIPIGTVKSRLANARKKLKERVEAYEKDTGSKLDFQDAAGLLGTTLLTMTSSTKSLTTASLFPKSIPTKTFLQSGMQMISSPALLLAASVTVVTAGGYALHKQYENANTSILPPIEQFAIDTANPFPSTSFLGKEIHSSREAYYHLKMEIAMQDMDEMDMQTKAEMDRLITALQDANSEYYQTLMSEEWGVVYQNVNK